MTSSPAALHSPHACFPGLPQTVSAGSLCTPRVSHLRVPPTPSCPSSMPLTSWQFPLTPSRLSCRFLPLGSLPLGGMTVPVPSAQSSNCDVTRYCNCPPRGVSTLVLLTFGLDRSLWWRLSCVLKDAEQHPWPLHHDNQKYLQALPSVPWGHNPQCWESLAGTQKAPSMQNRRHLLRYSLPRSSPPPGSLP